MTGYRTIALTVSTAVFMQFLDATALNTALPAMARDFHVPAVNLNVAILAYQLALAAFIPVGNIAADRWGARNAFAASLFVFLTGSLLCAASRSLPALVAARAFQGLGGSVMMPISRQLVIRSAEKHELVSAMNWLLLPGIIGPLLGPVVGGLIVTYASWHWIFLINLPVALIGIVATMLLVPNGDVRSSGKIDTKGVLLIAATIVCLIFGLEGLAHPHAGLESVALLLAGLAIGLVYVRHAAGNPDAALDLSLLRIGSFRHSAIAGTIMRTIIGAMGFLMPLWFQLAMGMNAAQSGMLSVAGTFGAMLSRPLSGLLIRRAHPRPISIAGAACFVLTLLVIAMLMPEPRILFAIMLLVQGLSVAIALIIISAAAYVDVPSERLGAATGLYTTIQQLTLSLGVTAGVWTIGVMRWLMHSGTADGLTYRGSLVILAALAATAVYAASKIDEESLAALRARREAGR